MIIISLIIYFYFYCTKFDPAVVISFILFIRISSYEQRFSIAPYKHKHKHINNIGILVCSFSFTYVRCEPEPCLATQTHITKTLNQCLYNHQQTKTARFNESIRTQEQPILKTTENIEKYLPDERIN